ncbi:hypothetical protein REPUB_Repub09cG0102500 [Reevesia pubescens]
MKRSSIALHYKDYEINLIDSPGQMDFCSEVSTAAWLSDGGLVLIDAVEGVHIQTHAVLRQSWIEKVTPCLVLNKIDRLICELKLNPMEAYNRLLRIVHEVSDENLESIEDDEEDTFQPQKGNVAFVCALDGWGFTINEFAEFYASKLGASTAALQKAFWGPRYFNPKTKMIVGKKGVGGGSKARPMFVQFVLEPLWQVYQAALKPDGDKGMLEKVIKSFSLSVPPHELQNKDPKILLQAVMSRWLPLSDAVFSMVVKWVDSNVLAEVTLLRKSVEACDSSLEAPCIAFVSKMFAVPTKMLPQGGPHGEILNNFADEGGSCESDECFLAFARIFSGVLTSGQRVLGWEYCGNSWTWPAYIKKCNSFVHKKLLAFLQYGIPDPFVEVTVSSREEHVLAAGGEVHLERCIKYLKERFAKVRLEVSPPLVPYKETIEGDLSNPLEDLKLPSASSDYVEKMTPNGRCVICVQVMKLPATLTKVLDESADLLSSDIIGGKPGQSGKSLEIHRLGVAEDESPIDLLRKRIVDALEVIFCVEMKMTRIRLKNAKESSDNSVLIRGSPHVSLRLGLDDNSSAGDMAAVTPLEVTQPLYIEAESLESSLMSGFQLAIASGPLCDEPMWGLAFVVEAYISPSTVQVGELKPNLQSEQYGLFTGQVMTAVKDACRAAVLQRKPRLVEAMYFCELNTPTEYLGPIIGFADELRIWTSGASSALLVLSHWEALLEDPFFVPKTEEEIEEFGDGSSVLPNIARKLIDAVRRRKGLPEKKK